MFSRSWIIALGDSGTVLWFILYWFCHATGQAVRMIPVDVALLNAMFPFLVDVTADTLSLSIGNKRIYPFKVLQVGLFQATHHMPSAVPPCHN